MKHTKQHSFYKHQEQRMHGELAKRMFEKIFEPTHFDDIIKELDIKEEEDNE